MNSGQRAMATAMLYPDPEKGGRGNKNSLLGKGFSAASLSQARTVLKDSRALAEDVLFGRRFLDAAAGSVHGVVWHLLSTCEVRN